MNLEQIAPPIDVSTAELDIKWLGVQLDVAQALVDNPAITTYIKAQIDHLTRKLIDANICSMEGSTAKAAVVTLSSQIKAYEHLYDLARNITTLRDTFTQRTTRK